MKHMIVGCGNIGRRLSLYLQQENPLALVKSQESLQQCQQVGLTAQQIDLDAPLLIDPAQVNEALIFYFVAPAKFGAVDNRLRQFLQWAKDRPQRIVLISTTGVYGDCGGNWVDENSALNPVVERALRRIDAEQQLRQWAQNNQREFLILRVPGIYAQDRLPLARLLRGEPILIPEQSPFTNRIHADDLARICLAAMKAKHSNLVLNASDGNPSTMTEYFNHVADFAGLPRPPLIRLEEARQVVSGGMLSYLQESRRISNQLLLKTLQIKLRYPSLADALPIHFSRAE